MTPTPLMFKSLKQRDLMPVKEAVECWKKPFTTAEDAAAALRRCQSRPNKNGRRAEVAYYLCKNCGCFHLTSEEQRPVSTAGWTL